MSEKLPFASGVPKNRLPSTTKLERNREIYRRLCAGETTRDVAADYNVSCQLIRLIRKRYVTRIAEGRTHMI